MRIAGIFLFMTLVLSACNSSAEADMDKEKEAIRKADMAFSDLSKQEGMKAAFLEYMDTAAILLRPDHYPIVGPAAREYLQNTNDSSFILTWEPSAAEVSSAGDLGFTYGIYTLNTKDTVIKGTYVSIWKKQDDGNWKFLLDTGNPGLAGEK